MIEQFETDPGNDQPIFLRSHHDNLGDLYSMATGTANLDESLTRTEFADEADINKILDRYITPAEINQRQVKYGETIDYSIGLQEALHAVKDAEFAYEETVPPELRNSFPTWREWLNGAANGSYEHALAELAKTKATAEERNNPPKPEETPNPESGEKKTAST